MFPEASDVVVPFVDVHATPQRRGNGTPRCLSVMV